MKNVILILGILTTIMVFGVVAGVSTNASPPALDMDLNEDTCRFCHVGNLQGEHHSSLFFKTVECSECHGPVDGKPINGMDNTCGLGIDCHNTTSSDNPIKLVTNHHDFTAIFEGDEWDCIDCHEKGVPRPLDK